MDRDPQLTRLGLFDAKVPRYTSYPTAPHFNAATGPAEFAGFLAAIPPGARISLYLHVPFCRRLCWFCACRTQGTSSDSPVTAYLDTLKAELQLLAHHLPEGVTLSRLHWGGGTPTLLSAAAMTDLAQAIFAIAPMAAEGEFSVEIDPNEIDEARLDALAAAGMNRASIGVQDFDPAIQKAIGREQSYEITRSAAEGLRARGIKSLNADILFGLPHQTPGKITASVAQLLTLRPDRVALYGYAHVPWMSRRQQLIPSEALPAPQERLALFDTARALFEAEGYRQIGIDHFALPEDGLARAAESGQLRRNFQGYTDDPSGVLIGLGASSISRFPGGYAQNAAATGDYTSQIRAGRFATARGHLFQSEDLLRARIIEALMCDFRVDKAELRRRFPKLADPAAPLFARAAEEFGPMVENRDDSFEIPPRGRALTRMIARSFDAYDLSRASHSGAI
ncbi:oxygen-independent coproporphyrinogen III oxidase [Falsigemmobacter faecalis]|uniref:Coproporphyrinogen-III oxidase n=1 Tax=Falsigemmobacter faecalis TaxID=2488730 RepID=A0A3P3DNI2_9RHOB|nr:oxygen-independent coproporphyrinogen III oxidase [Falsigemmobacter faecalis]RRH75504.1 oxygen-independent coproporphyrinogen III oxidase [Falsigemmobacter faecalis]